MSFVRTTAARCVALVAAIGAGRLAAGSENVVIYSNIAGHPTAQVPGVPGEEFRSPLAPFLSLFGSPLGSHWIFKAFTDNPSSSANDVIVVGSGTTGTVVAKEGDPAPIGGLTYGFMDSDCGINDSAGIAGLPVRATPGGPACHPISGPLSGLRRRSPTRDGR